MDKEEWKDVVGYEGIYKVSNLGRVLSIHRINRGRTFGNKIRSPMVDRRNRYTMMLSKNGKTKVVVLARMVAEAFVKNENPSIYTEVNHLDEDPSNNRADNLEWCTHKYNCNYGTRIQRIKEKQNIPVLQYTLDGKFVAEYASMHIAAEAINADAGHICDSCLGNRSYAYGYFWRYKDDVMYEDAKKRLKKKIEYSKKSRADKFTARALNVVQLDMNGNYIQTFQSTRLAAEAVGSHRPTIINCCNGKVQHVKGYKFVYERDYTEPESGQQLSLF